MERLSGEVADFFNERSVQFGDVPRYSEQSAWPFFYSLDPYPSVDDTLFPDTLTKSLAGLGWPILPGTFRDIPIGISQDTHFHFITHKLSVFRGDVVGSISALADAVAVVGVGTLFLSEYQIGDEIAVIDDIGQSRFAIVAAIADDLNLTLKAPFGGNAVTAASSIVLPSEYRIGNQTTESMFELSGGIQVVGAAVTGIGTAFDTQLQVGQTLKYVDDLGNHVQGTIGVIGGALAATFTSNPGNVAGANGVAYKIGITPKLAEKYYRNLFKYLRVSIAIKSNNGVQTIGGASELGGSAVFVPASLGNGANGLLERPPSVQSIQSKNDGDGSLKSFFQIPKDGMLVLRIHNAHTRYKLFVCGHVFGYKVAL